MSQLVTGSTAAGTTAGTSGSEATELVRQHRRVVRAVAEVYGEDVEGLERKTIGELERNRDLIADVLKSRNDRRRGELVGLVAASCVRCEGTVEGNDDPARIARDIETIDDPQLRDVMYSRYWLGKSPNEIATLHETRVQAIHQLHARAIKKLGYEISDIWRSRRKMRLNATAEEAIQGNASELVVDAMAACAQSYARIKKLYIGQRTVRIEYGRAWIEPPERLSIAEQRLMAAEQRAAYQRTRAFTVIANPDIFALEVSLFMNVGGGRSVSAVWVSGKESVAILDSRGDLITVCGPESPGLELGSSPGPIEIWLRETGGV